MIRISKRLRAEKEKLNQNQVYSFVEAIDLLKKTSSANFDESVEAHIALNIDPKYADQQLRTTVVLPHGTGRSLKIAILATSNQLEEAQTAKADLFGSDDLFEDISRGTLNFDLLIATPDMMPKLAKLGRILGPKGLMPSPKAGTVSTNLVESVQEFKKGKVEYRADKTGIVHISFGKASFSNQQLFENLLAFFNSVEKNKPVGVKGKYIKSFSICSTMGPSIPVDFLLI